MSLERRMDKEDVVQYVQRILLSHEMRGAGPCTTALLGWDVSTYQVNPLPPSRLLGKPSVLNGSEINRKVSPSSTLCQ